ncbi:hypothetical protein PR048_012435 [Dryococelus australis]|uniref:Uncharacterized protein n=1 Tax=Dryococelus australis TaxID=614101 RepID=A0ABQ9HPJ9_9NEOP|nr:hypothetical protein PR048_012435 [Dryococelus australis]
MSVIGVSMDQRRNETAWETGDPEKTRRPTASSCTIPTSKGYVISNQKYKFSRASENIEVIVNQLYRRSPHDAPVTFAYMICNLLRTQWDIANSLTNQKLWSIQLYLKALVTTANNRKWRLGVRALYLRSTISDGSATQCHQRETPEPSFPSAKQTTRRARRVFTDTIWGGHFVLPVISLCGRFSQTGDCVCWLLQADDCVAGCCRLVNVRGDCSRLVTGYAGCSRFVNVWQVAVQLVGGCVRQVGTMGPALGRAPLPDVYPLLPSSAVAAYLHPAAHPAAAAAAFFHKADPFFLSPALAKHNLYLHTAGVRMASICRPFDACEVIHLWDIDVESIWVMLGPFVFTTHVLVIDRSPRILSPPFILQDRRYFTGPNKNTLHNQLRWPKDTLPAISSPGATVLHCTQQKHTSQTIAVDQGYSLQHLFSRSDCIALNPTKTHFTNNCDGPRILSPRDMKCARIATIMDILPTYFRLKRDGTVLPRPLRQHSQFTHTHHTVSLALPTSLSLVPNTAHMISHGQSQFAASKTSNDIAKPAAPSRRSSIRHPYRPGFVSTTLSRNYGNRFLFPSKSVIEAEWSRVCLINGDPIVTERSREIHISVWYGGRVGGGVAKQDTAHVLRRISLLYSSLEPTPAHTEPEHDTELKIINHGTSVLDQGHSGFLYVGIVPDDTAGWWVISGISRLPLPCIPVLLHIHFVSPSSALKTPMDVANEVAWMVCTVHSRTDRPMRKLPYVWQTSFADEAVFLQGSSGGTEWTNCNSDLHKRVPVCREQFIPGVTDQRRVKARTREGMPPLNLARREKSQFLSAQWSICE